MFTRTNHPPTSRRRHRRFGRRDSVYCPRRHLIDLAGPLIVAAVIGLPTLAAAVDYPVCGPTDTPATTKIADRSPTPANSPVDTTGQPATGHQPGDTLSPTEGDTSRYDGPTVAPVTQTGSRS